MQSKYNNCGIQYVDYTIKKSYKELEAEISELKQQIKKLIEESKKQENIITNNSLERKQYMQELVSLREENKRLKREEFLQSWKDNPDLMGR